MITCVAVFGATGRSGERLVAEALGRGWQVRALVRAEKQPSPSRAGLGVTRGSLTDPAALAETLSGCDAACCVFGPRPPYTDRFCADATRAIVAAATRAGVSRLICQTGAMLGPYRANRTLPFHLMAWLFARRQPAAAADRWQQELAVRDSGLAWTIIKPPRLTDGPARGRVRAGPRLRVGLGSSISRRDLARVMADELAAPRFLNQTIFVAG